MDLIELDLADPAAVREFLRSIKMPIEPAVCLRYDDKLFVTTSSSSLMLVTDPYDGVAVDMSETIQTYITSGYNPFHKVGMNGSGELVDLSTGIGLELLEYDDTVWYGAVMDVVFGRT